MSDNPENFFTYIWTIRKMVEKSGVEMSSIWKVKGYFNPGLSDPKSGVEKSRVEKSGVGKSKVEMSSEDI